jgi:hypothetical protein
MKNYYLLKDLKESDIQLVINDKKLEFDPKWAWPGMIGQHNICIINRRIQEAMHSVVC